ncbi:BZ3500_MvSof-1268-A1-R1_Chr1-1g00892 [Microbotryum saponariae]|uniref:BZ3500_MvSof-1268-A1-R1_Chr1-1g00892 protein n=1 Tax=Microbotryum saponariae TaxID=289078 RepID=A0A2X0K7N0_9BASI|nr:BZ3500_MvSof-1268-A1-R1_Chr1-1g00892 [Microbotryum saponariae]SCZ92874.1 BZ3501_MvSof-1269-A2-R1_Chr1-1g00489 [Microbotryum saponariae]
MGKSLNVAICQFASIPPTTPNNGELNLARAHDFVRQAAQQGAQLVVFPEYFLSGIIADPQHHHLAQLPHHEHATASSSESSSPEQVTHWLETFRRLAVELKIDIVPGTIVERGTDSEQLHNVAHYISKDGTIKGRYVKRNLWHPEKTYLTRGEEEHQVFETEWGKVGMLICWDLAWPEAFQALLLQGVDIIIIPTCWLGTDGDDIGLLHDPHCEEKFLDATIISRAFENECVIVFVNAGGEASQGWIGRSGVTVPFKGKIGGTKDEKEELVVVKVGLGILEDARTVYGLRKDLVEKVRQRKGATETAN